MKRHVRPVPPSHGRDSSPFTLRGIPYMHVSRFARRSALLAAFALLPVLSGCGSNPFNPPIDPGGDGHVPGDTPVNDSPQNLMIRFEKSYEFQDLPTYEGLLTSDFRYTFSAASDPNLVSQYPNWGRDDEEESTQHLFDGFTNQAGNPVPAASQIQMTLTGVQYQGDFLHPDSASHYQKVVVTQVDMSIDVPDGASITTFVISARHEFYIVRGDVAVLSAGQEASPNRWYIRRWDDLSPPPPAAIARLSSINGQMVQRTPVTWGAMKDSFYH